jgi:ABC-type transporter Mla subunit MlaD
MSPIQPDRLDRIEDALDRVTHVAENTAAVAAENTKRFTELAEALLRLSDAQLRTNQNVDTAIARIDEMQSEVRGLQIENRRILDRIFPGQP